MKLTTKGRYAVTAILDLALHAGEGPVCLADVSSRQGISNSYLEQLFAKLRKCGIVKSVRGPGGGYVLGRDEHQIFVSQIIDAVNETVDATRCGGKGDCQKGETCLTHNLWEALSHEIHGFLKTISIGSLVNQQTVQKVAQRQDEQVASLETAKGMEMDRGMEMESGIDSEADGSADTLTAADSVSIEQAQQSTQTMSQKESIRVAQIQ